MRTVIVTGGTRRLGAYIAERLRADGWQVLTTSSRSDAGADIVADLATAEGADILFAAAKELCGGRFPKALVNNAALFVGDPEKLRQLNYLSPVRLIRLMAERPAGRGAVVNILDAQLLNGRAAIREASRAYDETKVALMEFTRAAAEEFAATLRIGAVAPGPVLPPEGFHLKAPPTPGGRPTPESVADEVAGWLSEGESGDLV